LSTSTTSSAWLLNDAKQGLNHSPGRYETTTTLTFNRQASDGRVPGGLGDPACDVVPARGLAHGKDP
jgi:hypothetical protein